VAHSPVDVARAIEHTLLRPEATAADVDRLCDEAVEHAFFGVCTNPIHVRRAARRLEGSGVRVVTVIGFPLGAETTEVKCCAARRALADGADELDVVAPIGALRAGDHRGVRADIEAVAHVAHGGDRPAALKVILETAALPDEAIVLGCRCCAEGEADFVKTSTGFHPAGGATVEMVRRLKRLAAPMRVKAAGGIRDAATALAMLDAGADRIGTCSGVAIMAHAGRA